MIMDSNQYSVQAVPTEDCSQYAIESFYQWKPVDQMNGLLFVQYG